ncbi:hypothetical protein BDN71DRAFT_1514517 [Pleurotus eryngii]|uniref:Uncharacterized protein n=1 Tax=Pleurotus eryngii TaxID=5323 RepID=A0A9P5ZEQ0_PLEER|nr:hypothetical protein BDN71DRAFT_1514517 [Pleurotus eryngii]
MLRDCSEAATIASSVNAVESPLAWAGSSTGDYARRAGYILPLAAFLGNLPPSSATARDLPALRNAPKPSKYQLSVTSTTQRSRAASRDAWLFPSIEVHRAEPMNLDPATSIHTSRLQAARWHGEHGRALGPSLTTTIETRNLQELGAISCA